jgi:hypothetical protein
MRVPSLLLAALAVTLSQVPIHAQGSAFDQIVAADGLRYKGEPKAAVVILESMVQTQASGMLESDLGVTPKKGSQQRAGQPGVAAVPRMYDRCQRFQVTGDRMASKTTKRGCQ